MTFKEKLIQRHKNPIGLGLRFINYLAIGYGLWTHHLALIFLLILVDVMNWFFMPMVHPKKELKFVTSIVQTEIEWMSSPWTVSKFLSIIIALVLFGLLGIGLWTHNWILLVIAFVLIAILKQLILKMTTTKSG
ncbi:MAG: hypothetical protein HRT61_17235 [Ekhidna sp.]|nr:hypothetical protein [Ekhidna sp.]